MGSAPWRDWFFVIGFSARFYPMWWNPHESAYATYWEIWDSANSRKRIQISFVIATPETFRNGEKWTRKKCCRVWKIETFTSKNICENFEKCITLINLLPPFNSLWLLRLSWWQWSSLNRQHHAARTCLHRAETPSRPHQASTAHQTEDNRALPSSSPETPTPPQLSNQEPTTDHPSSSSRETLSLSNRAQTMEHPSNQARTMAPHNNSNLAQTMVHLSSSLSKLPLQPPTEPPQPRTSTTSTANAPIATSKPRPTNTVPHPKTATATTRTADPTVDTEAADMKNQQSTNSNTTFKMIKLASTSDTRNNAKDPSPLENTTSCCLMAANK